MNNKLFLTLALCIAAPASGMRVTAAKFKHISICHRAIRSWPIRWESWDKEEHADVTKAEVEKLRVRVAAIEQEVWKVVRKGLNESSFMPNSLEHHWLAARIYLPKLINGIEERDALQILIELGEPFDTELPVEARNAAAIRLRNNQEELIKKWRDKNGREWFYDMVNLGADGYFVEASKRLNYYRLQTTVGGLKKD